MYDVIIIGGGVVGCALARELSFYAAKVLLLEKASDLAEGASIANSGIIHAGHDPHEGTSKARYNLEGNWLYESLSKQCFFGFQRTGAFVVSRSSEETDRLIDMMKQALRRGIEAKLLTGDEARYLEPNLSDHIQAALSLPTTGIVDPWEVAIAFAEEADLNGVEIHLQEKVQAIDIVEGGYRVTTTKGSYDTVRVVNAAGVYADEIAAMIGVEDFAIRPRKGNYYVLDKDYADYMKRPIYPLPTEKGKGMLIVPTLHGNLLFGPDSEFVDNKAGNDTEADRLDAIKKSLSELAKDLPLQGVIRTFAGLRATGSTGDFVVREEKDHPGFFQAACLESPGLTAAPAIAKDICHWIVKGNFPRKEEHIPRPKPLSLKGMSLEEKDALAKKDPAYGRLVCYCEEITEAEVLDAIHRPLGAKTIKAVKKRVRPGTGRCQGSFCEPRVVEILSRELNVSPEELRYAEAESVMFYEED